MAGTNNFLPIGTAGGANVQTQVVYAADPNVPTGFGLNAVPGSALWNKMMRQSSVVTSQLMQMLADYSNLNMLDDGNLATLLANMKTQFRVRLLANTTFYVRTDGNNANSGLVNNAGGAWLTLQRASDVLFNQYDFNGFQVTIQMADGTYAGALMNGLSPGQVSQLIINGNAVTPANVLFNTTITIGGNSRILVQNLKSAGGGAAFICGDIAGLTVGVGIEVGAQVGSTSAHFYANGSGNISILQGYKITGGAGSHYLSFNSGNITVSSAIAITLTGTPAFAQAFASAEIKGSISINTQSGAPVYTGAATGPRFVINNLSAIFSNGVISSTYFPGSIAGTNLGNGAIYN